MSVGGQPRPPYYRIYQLLSQFSWGNNQRLPLWCSSTWNDACSCLFFLTLPVLEEQQWRCTYTKRFKWTPTNRQCVSMEYSVDHWSTHIVQPLVVVALCKTSCLCMCESLYVSTKYIQSIVVCLFHIDCACWSSGWDTVCFASELPW